MGQIYEIEIEETLSKVVKIEAESLDEAIDIAQKRYSNEEYVLDYNNFLSVDIRSYDDLLSVDIGSYNDEKMKEKGKQNDRDTR